MHCSEPSKSFTSQPQTSLIPFLHRYTPLPDPTPSPPVAPPSVDPGAPAASQNQYATASFVQSIFVTFEQVQQCSDRCGCNFFPHLGRQLVRRLFLLPRKRLEFLSYVRQSSQHIFFLSFGLGLFDPRVCMDLACQGVFQGQGYRLCCLSRNPFVVLIAQFFKRHISAPQASISSSVLNTNKLLPKRSTCCCCCATCEYCQCTGTGKTSQHSNRCGWNRCIGNESLSFLFLTETETCNICTDYAVVYRRTAAPLSCLVAI